jgi:FeS assembly SUF system protein
MSEFEDSKPAQGRQDPQPGGSGADSARPAGAAPAAGAGSADLEKQVIDVLKTCFDPEIPVNIYELGLIYKIEIQPPGAVRVEMTLTSPMCPVAGSLPPEVQTKIGTVPGVTSAKVDVVWEPPWNPAMMSEAAKLQLGFL